MGNQKGFTIVELMIATSVFSVLLLVASATVVRFTNGFQKALAQNTTQNVTRSIVDTVSQSLQFGGGMSELADNGSTKGYCVGSVNYSFLLGRRLGSEAGDVQHALVQLPGTGVDCGAGNAQNLTSGPVSGSEMLSDRMRLSKFNISKAGNVFTVTVKVAYGDDDLLDDPTGPDSKCKDQQAGTQFCAVSELSTTVKARIY
jgi:prepilin-type N-terminal cleavage/methylation domain-containing protein